MEATVKNSTPIRSKNQENADPNFAQSSPVPKNRNSPAVKYAQSHKSACKNLNPVCYISPRKKNRERKFIVAKKHAKKEDPAVGSSVTCSKCRNAKKCLCLAYENLRASQEDFFKKWDADSGELSEPKGGEVELGEEMERYLMIHDLEIGNFEGSSLNDPEFCKLVKIEGLNQEVSSTVKRRRDRLMEEARKSQPDVGAGKVMHLVKAFERLLTIPKKDEQVNEEEGDQANKVDDNSKKASKWALPGLPPPKAIDTDFSSCSFSQSELILTSENLGLDSRASTDSSRGSISSRTSNGGQRSRRNSAESYGTFGGSRWKKKKKHIRVTSQKPFKLRTEQRGRIKEEEFMKKMQELMEEEERLRIPIAQGLPWTTDEPECLIKPPVKENTKPLDLKLHSDLRAVERSEFDQQIADKLAQIERYKQERERLQKLAEEEEIRRLRREQVPKAQPMPYFDRPFMPKRSSKNPTIPKEPKLHIPQLKKIKCGVSLNDIVPYAYEKYHL